MRLRLPAMLRRPHGANDALVQRLGAALLVGIALASLFWIASAYLDPALHKAIIYSGLGVC
jgi:hypothetical protein